MSQPAGRDEHERASAKVDREVARLYELYADRIFGYCLYRLGNRTEAEDAVQTTFLYVFRGLQRGVIPEVESSWLFTIAHNVCRSTRRSARRRGRVESQQDPQLLQELSPGVERDHDSLLGLEDALASIPENQRRAILLREWQGMPYREIAETLGLTQTAVEMLVFRARRSLADALEQPQPRTRRRAARALNFGSLVSAARSFFNGLSTAKVAAAAGAIVVATTAGGAAPVRLPAGDRAAHAPSALPRAGVVAAELAPVAPRKAAPARGGPRVDAPTPPSSTATGASAAATSASEVGASVPAAATAPPASTAVQPAGPAASSDVTLPSTTATPALTIPIAIAIPIPVLPAAVPSVDVPSVSVDARHALDALPVPVTVTKP